MFASILGRLGRVIKRDFTVFKEIRFDPKANAEAAFIVVVVSLVTALSAALYSSSFLGTTAVRFFAGVLLNWALWSYVTIFIITNLYGVDVEFWQMARLMGYANSAMLLSIGGIFGCFGSLVASLAWVLVLVLAFFMIRESFELSTEQTIVTVVIGWLVVFLITLTLNLVFRLG